MEGLSQVTQQTADPAGKERGEGEGGRASIHPSSSLLCQLIPSGARRQITHPLAAHAQEEGAGATTSLAACTGWRPHRSQPRNALSESADSLGTRCSAAAHDERGTKVRSKKLARSLAHVLILGRRRRRRRSNNANTSGRDTVCSRDERVVE